MYGKLNGEGIEYAPINYETEDGNLILNFNKNEQLMMQYGYKMVIEQIPEYNIDTEDIYISEYQETDENITIIYSVTTKPASEKFATEDYVQESVEGVENWLTEVETIVYENKEKIGENELATEDKAITGAINELFLDVDNGKQLIATAIDNENITGDSTFDAMSEAILELRRKSEEDVREILYNMMIEDGYNEINSEMTVDELITLLDDSQIEIDDIKQIVCGQHHTFIIKNDGTLWTCGYNNYGQLGLGDTANRNTFTQVTTNINNDVKQVACGCYHTIIIKNNGSIWSCGYNNKGQLGLGDTSTYTSFTQVTTNINNDVKQVVCDEYHTFILKNDGSLYSCGNNEYGQLGLGTSTTTYTSFTQVTTNINNDVIQIACGSDHTFILKNDGSVYSCGHNNYGQLGLGNNTNQSSFTQVTTNINNDVKQIACGYKHTFILKNDGSVYSCGYNYTGELGLGTNGSSANETSFTKVTTNINNDIKRIACGGNHTFILKNDGTVWACGYNYYGQLGLGDTSKRTEFINTNFYIPLSEYEINRQKLYYYLLNNSIDVTEDMDIDATMDELFVILIDIYEMPRVKDMTYVTDMYTSGANSYALKSDGTLYYVGQNNYGLSGLGENTILSFTQIATDVKICSGGSRYSIILKNDGTLWGCGYNGDYEISNTSGNKTSFIEINGAPQNIKEIVCGYSHYFVITEDNKVYARGNNSYGQSCNGNYYSDLSYFEEVTTISNIKQVSAGNRFSYVLTEDGTIWSCGDNTYGQLGLGHEDDESTLTQVSDITNVKKIICGKNTAFILKNDGTVWGCGYNGYGQLGLGSTSPSKVSTFTQMPNIYDAIDVISTDYLTLIIRSDNTLWGCGLASGALLSSISSYVSGTLTSLFSLSKVKKVVYDGYAMFLLYEDNRVYGCGTNEGGQLGLGVEDSLKYTTPILIKDLNPIVNGNLSALSKTLLDEETPVLFDETLDDLSTKATEIFNEKNVKINELEGNMDSGAIEIYNILLSLGKSTSIDLSFEEQLSILKSNNSNITNVKEFLALNSSCLLVTNDGKLYAWGGNFYGHLGFSSTDDVTVPTLVDISDVSTILGVYSNRTFILKNDGTLWGCGYNSYGMLGLSNATSSVKTYTQITTNVDNNNIKQIACGYNHTIMLMNDGTIWVCGANDNGQLGLSDTSDIYGFTQISDISDVKQIACGNRTTYIVKNDSSLWVSGMNNYGQLGLEDTDSRNTFTQVTTNVKAVYSPAQHVIIVKNDGTVWGCGQNDKGQLGLGDKVDRNTFTQVPNISDVDTLCVYTETCAMKNDGTIWGWGENKVGQLGLGDMVSRLTPTQITINADNIKQISIGLLHMAVFKNDGTIWVCGANTDGQLGTSGAISDKVPYLTQVLKWQ